MINMERNIRELLKDTIFAHPDDIATAKTKGRVKPKTGKKEKNGKEN
tara:strand:- start:1065 stop:1205 length:141 start_codon:yes stop_codon:yes gene_type:complete